MKSIVIIGLFGLALSTVACSSSSSAPSDVGSSSANRLVLDVRCATNADCPSGFECEIEVQSGVSQSDCRSHEPVAAGTTATCPPGFEPEAEGGGLLCKPHGGAAGGAAGGSSSGSGVDDDGGAASGKGLDDDAGAATGTSTGACKTSADCPVGLECSIELGVATCKAHGGKK